MDDNVQQHAGHHWGHQKVKHLNFLEGSLKFWNLLACGSSESSNGDIDDDDQTELYAGETYTTIDDDDYGGYNSDETSIWQFGDFPPSLAPQNDWDVSVNVLTEYTSDGSDGPLMHSDWVVVWLHRFQYIAMCKA